ncbi:MAG: aminopeptidase [Patescibacteria group bacterium]|nr:aminopeptidase [Patescibacteria group bacterium]
MAKKINYQNLEKKLKFERRNCWEVWSGNKTKKAFAFCEDYKKFLDQAKTEREAVRAGIKIAQKNGFKEIGQCKTLKAGDKVYAVNRDKNLILTVVGKKLLGNGFKLIMSHIDSPRLDLKVQPLYEDENLAFLKTHYYGGIKKYHWPTIPLALHGAIVLENGKKADIKIGEDDNDPIFMITDLLPHLAKKQLKKPLEEAIAGEELNILVGSVPVADKEIKEKVKLAILKHINKTYGMAEEDFVSADIQAVPAACSRDIGFDRSMIAGYGQDDKVCAYPSLSAICDVKLSDKTQICLWIDREEIGSEGATGAQSIFFENFIARILELSGSDSNIKNVYQVFSKSQALSSDVTAAIDPDYKEVSDPRNSAKLGYGVAVEKYTGHRGKSGASEASAEYAQKIRKILNNNKIIWQTDELGKIDEGGGGTIAMFMAKRNIDIIDMGVALFNMHAPLEIASKADIYCSFLAYKAFFKE